MSDSYVFNRRDFLRLVGIGVAGTAMGCGTKPADRLIPYLVAPQDILPGVPYWYASTCRECPAGCGILVKTREGRTVKIEGNPDHPIGRGGLCARGHAALQGLYDPDRIAGPMVKDGGTWKRITWEQGLQLAGERLRKAKADQTLFSDEDLLLRISLNMHRCLNDHEIFLRMLFKLLDGDSCLIGNLLVRLMNYFLSNDF